MDEEIDRAARCIGESLRAHQRLTVTDLCALLGGRQDILARTLASLLIRDLIVFGREKGNLYVMLQDAEAPREAPQERASQVPVTIL